MTPSWKKQLPTYYYLDHFDEVVRFVTSRYAEILASDLAAFLAALDTLDRDARCLLVRIVNRKGTVFDHAQFTYAEIGDIPAAFSALENAGFAGRLTHEDFDSFLQGRTKQHLIDLARQSGCEMKGLAAKKKTELLGYVRRHVDFGQLENRGALSGFFAQRQTEVLGFVLFLYFGHFRTDLTAFTMRDLGLVKTNAFREDDQAYRARYPDAASARAAYFYARMGDAFESADRTALLIYSADLANWPIVDHPESARRRTKALTRFGKLLERHDEKEAALEVYRQVGEHPASERAVRLAYAIEGKKSVESLLLAMIDDPASDDELLFAEDFYARKFKKQRVGELSRLLRDAPTIPADESRRDSPENAAVEWYSRRGTEAFYTENGIWNMLFGLLFWDLLFGKNADLHSGFDRLPASLKQRTFYTKNVAAIEARLGELQDTDSIATQLAESAARYSGTVNGVFSWDPRMLPIVEVFLRTAQPAATATVLRRMAEDYPGTRSGFPDLLVNAPEGWTFIEIKAEGDQLSRSQLKQLKLLERAGFGVGVRRIAWTVDPMQDYVVVDIETTGHNGPGGRITEIAAIKVRDGAVVDQWHSLVNPGRAIPKFITQLTGIDNGMVRDQPGFENLADSLRTFLEGCVFVAHNAPFDYGFIRSAYARIEQPFQLPTLCTKVGMRRFYPGLRSYGLKNLCSEFSIPLDEHHRALCDAQATVELLHLINKKRRFSEELS